MQHQTLQHDYVRPWAPPFYALALLSVAFPRIKKNKKKEVEKVHVARKWKEENEKRWEKKPNLNCQNWKVLERRKEVYEESSDGKEWKNESEGEDKGKGGRNKEGGVTIHHHLFISTPYNYDYADDNMVFFILWLC